MSDEIKYIKLSEKEVKEIIDNLKGTQFINAFAIINHIEACQEENQQLKEQLQQRDSVIEETIKYLEGSYEMSTYTKSVTLEKENIDDLLDILNKYKKEES